MEKTPKRPDVGKKDLSCSPLGDAGSDDKKAKEVTIAQSSPEIMNPELPIKQYRDLLARDLERREAAVRSPPSALTEKVRVSPIHEEGLATSPTAVSGSDVPTASTESSKTIRPGSTPGTAPGWAARTPSYPFPRMTPTYNHLPWNLREAFGNRSQSGTLKFAGGQFENSVAAYDQLRSDPSTPQSAMTFLPGGVPHPLENFDFPTPNLYDLALMLSAEPGLDAWWSAVTQIMKEHYMAERVTLSIPADATDLENVPWGQKATYNTIEGDELSMGYLGRGSSMMPSSTDEQFEMTSNMGSSQRSDMSSHRPGMQSRHSFTSYEDRKEMREGYLGSGHGGASMPLRPRPMPRSKSYFPTTDKGVPNVIRPSLNKQTLEEHDAEESHRNVPSWEAPLVARRDAKGRILPVLQGLDLEADPLIDHNGVKRVIERGKVIALTRSYPYLDPKSDNQAREETKRKLKKSLRTESGAKLSSMLSNATAPMTTAGRSRKAMAGDKTKKPSLLSVMDDAEPRSATPKYEEYEQAPPSPWSQSPAPSPAVRAEPKDNPFFTDAMVDEESFNPGPSPHDYANMSAPETIGIDNSWTVLHIPLKHVLLSKTTPGFKLNSAALEEKTTRGRAGSKADVNPSPRPSSYDNMKKTQQRPIAILSVLSPIIPYPSNLRYSLEHLAAHLATSFSLARHYSNLETEVAGLHRKRPSTSGFGALAPDGRPLEDPMLFARMSYTRSEDPSQRSMGGSLASPSDYSIPSRSTAGSPSVTPNWDTGSFGMVMEKISNGTSPGQIGSDGYFGTKSRPGQGLVHGGHSSSGLRSSKATREPLTAAEKRHRRTSSWKHDLPEMAPSTEPEDIDSGTGSRHTSDEVTPTIATKKVAKETDNANNDDDAQERRNRVIEQVVANQSSNRHSMLHSYGADTATTLQSLPSGGLIPQKRPSPASVLQRSGSASTTEVTMLPPSDKLKGLMLDLLPSHVFVALPGDGEIVWVNSRYLTYRGQTIADLVVDPWGSIHTDDRDSYLSNWNKSLHTGETFSMTVRLRRFDGAYRYHLARAVASRDRRGSVRHFIGSYMDIHDQHTAEVKAARQEEIEASEAKHRLLANLIPQIIFTATEDEGITFANQQWLSYTGQSFEDAMGVGFMDYVHPDDLAKCRIPPDKQTGKGSDFFTLSGVKTAASATATPTQAGTSSLNTPRGFPQSLSRENSSCSSSSSEFFSPDLTELAKKGVIKVGKDSNGRPSYTTELRLRSKTDEYRWHLIRCVAIDNINFGSGASSYFGSATDINDHKLLEAKLKEAMESKSRFLSNMSHEIRTPLIGISGMVSFLQDTTLNEEQRDYTNTIQTSANSLLMIINDILDLSKVDAGMMKLNFEWFHTRSLIEDVNELVSTMAIAKRLELNYVVEGDVPSWVKGDKVRIRQVLLNVIGNAIKFTAHGEVFSRCKVLTSNTTGNDIMLEFSIIDTGRGFTAEEAELIFKPFSQIDGSSTRQHGGSGLGLVISRQLVELHGGKMDGTAVPGEGSTFTFSARFGLPSDSDHPDAIGTPVLLGSRQPSHESSDDSSTLTMKPLLLHKATDGIFTASPSSSSDAASPALRSSGSSDPSIRSILSQNTARSSVSSVNVGLVHFSEAARASGQELSQIKLEIPPSKPSPRGSPTPNGSKIGVLPDEFRPPMYSILIICPQTYSREATTKHIEMTLPKDVPHQITALASIEEAQDLIGGTESVTFTHIVLNLPSAEYIINMVDQITSTSSGKTLILVLIDSVQRQEVLKLASDREQQLLAENKIIFIYKPVKPSRFAGVFDPAKLRDLSIDRNRSTAAQMVESQRQSYIDVEKRIGNKGYHVLLVEDNPVNQKVLVRFLKKVGINAEIAGDGIECTEAVFSHPPGYYSLILCDLHMPRKDGYQACRDIRQWEKKGKYPKLPIIALSANVMSDVQEKCVAAGFSDYVTKPVDFIDLSNAMSKFF
ncbi:uncharacterized protein BCR38DRAFT_343233 [Pseudomassariella vexata]|uniref:histidine kinase n=1 Tax=Pseudomassariella vexata TaxID=1141098 RepID=A0A1Y2DZH1_9PEZI|nr:uncharacterized protein BCR38DRAFT_343233 [Pseudomassariella vexata]ORY64025.1 hypothetical protein BCR38DRAFT_343233 [Pseudomassariella vexata]